LPFSYEFVDFRRADAERLLRACDSDGERFHCAVSKSDPHSAGPLTAHDYSHD
jgi:hypothetical protein